MTSNPLISIITVNYNQTAVTAAMLRSLSRLTYKNFEVIVVDNASAESSAVLKREFPFITHITSPVNTGFAGGNNLGLHYAKGAYVFFVNNDTEVTPDLLTELVHHLQAHPGCAIACPKIKYFDKPDTIQYAGAVGLHPLTSRSYDIGYLQKDDGSFNDTRKTDLPNGAAMMIPMDVIQKLGTMSEMYFLYYEELDWAARFKKAGYEVHYVGTANIFHKESVSTGKNSAFKTFYIYRNRLLFIRRNYTGMQRMISGTFFAAISAPFHLLRHATKGEWGHVRAIKNALFWHFLHGPFKEPSMHSSILSKKLVMD